MPGIPSSPPAAPDRVADSARRGGTTAMLLGTALSAFGAYLFQVIGGRALGADSFAPVSVMWTLLFLGATVFLLPLEQLIIRRLTLSRGNAAALADSWVLIVSVVGAVSLIATGFAMVAREGLLDGDGSFVVVAAAMFPLMALLTIARGYLAGRRRFVAYGVVIGLDAVAKLIGAVVVVAADLGPVALSWALVVSPIVVLLVRPFSDGSEARSADGAISEGSDRRFMGGYLVATAASQTVLAAGPLVVGALGATPAAISVFFVTTTLFRGPMTASYNLVARVLPTFTRLAAGGGDDQLSHWARRLALGGAAASAASYVGAAQLGPAIVQALYGAEFRPSASLSGLAAAAVIAGMVGLATTQILVARGATGRMALVWLVALAAAALTIVVVPAAQEIRVAAGFLSGEAVALLGLTASALIPPRRTRPTA